MPTAATIGPVAGPAGVRPMAGLGVMMAGAGAVDAITTHLLPITARHFTDNLALIGVMVALNRVCGFLVQPYVAWTSDRRGGAAGRRHPYLLAAWPVVLLSLVALGTLPWLVPGEWRATAAAIAAFFVVNLVLQAALDVCYGAGDPCYGDLFRGPALVRAAGVRMVCSAVAGILMTLVFVPLGDGHELWPYAGAALLVALAWGAARFAVPRVAVPAVAERARYHPLRPLAELRDPHTRRVAWCASAVLVVLALTEMLHALFVTETLGFSRTVLGQTTTLGLVAGLAAPYPVGRCVERFGPRPVLLAGFAALAVVEIGFAVWVDDLRSLAVGCVLFRVAWVAVHLPIMPLLFARTAPERSGAVFAAVQMTRAGAASAATVLAGLLAEGAGSYRVCYLLAAAVCVAGAVGAARLPAAERLAPRPALA